MVGWVLTCEWNCCSGVHNRGKHPVARVETWELGMEVDSWCTSLQTGAHNKMWASSAKMKDMKIKLKFANYMEKTANGLMTAIFRKLTKETRPQIWFRQLTEYLRAFGFYFSYVHGGWIQMKLARRWMNNWERNRCRRDIESKITLEIYSNNNNVEYEGIHSNGYGSVLLFQCFASTLKLRWRQGFDGGTEDCLLCGGGEETVKHFYHWVWWGGGNKREMWCLWSRSIGRGADVWEKMKKRSINARKWSKKWGGRGKKKKKCLFK